MGKNKESTRKPSGYRFSSDTLKLTPGYNIVSQSMYPVYRVENPYTGEVYDSASDFSSERGRVIYNTPTQSDTVYFNTPDDWISHDGGYMPIGTTKDQDSAKKWFYKFAEWSRPRSYKDKKAHTQVLTEKKSIGGTMNRINYLENGGLTQNQQAKAQLEAFMKALLQGDPAAAQQLVQVAIQNPKSSAAQLIQNILNEEKQGNTEVSKAAQAIKQAIQQMQGQATSAKWGSKLGYIRSLKYAQGGKTCPACEKGAPIKVEEKACGGKAKKAKKRYFGGWL